MINNHTIVDTCVAASVGDPTSPRYQTARDVVDFLKSGPVGICMTDELLIEWRKHASRYMTRWLASMVSRGRTRHEIDKRVNGYRRALLKIPENQGRAAIVKDAHLVEAAILHGLGIISLDDRQRKLLRRFVASYELVGKVQWFNPVDQHSECLRWLKDGAIDRHISRILTPDGLR